MDVYSNKEELKNFIIESKIIMDRYFQYNDWKLNITKNEYIEE